MGCRSDHRQQRDLDCSRLEVGSVAVARVHPHDSATAADWLGIGHGLLHQPLVYRLGIIVGHDNDCGFFRSWPDGSTLSWSLS